MGGFLAGSVNRSVSVRQLKFDFLDIGVYFGPREKPLRTVSCLIEGLFFSGLCPRFWLCHASTLCNCIE